MISGATHPRHNSIVYDHNSIMHLKLPPVPQKLAPLPYIFHLPKKSLVHSGGNHIRVDENNALGASHINERGEHIVQLKPLPVDPFPEGAVAELPTCTSYVKTGNVWLPLAPSPVATPVLLAEQVPGHTGYWVVERNPYPTSFKRPLVIRFNLSMSRAKEDGVFGADVLPFCIVADKTFEEEIRIIIDLPVMGPGTRLVFSTRANAAITMGSLAKKIASEVENAFSAPHVLLVASMEGRLRKEVRFEDMFLVELVQRSEGDFQATIAVAVAPSEDACEQGHD